MRRLASKGTIAFVAFSLMILLLPLTVEADYQTQVTETVNLPAASSDNNEVLNPANATIPTNKDTWSPLPAGVFVGGTIAESKMQLNEMPLGNSALLVTTAISFQPSYIQNGASEFIVRLPVGVPDVADVTQVMLRIYDASPLDSAAHTTFNPGVIGYSNPDVFLNTSMPIVAEDIDVGGFWNHIGFPSVPIYSNMMHNSWLTGDRLYARVVAPIYSDHQYVFVERIYLRNSCPMQIYWHPSDLASDGVTSSRISYIWMPSVDTPLERDYPVNADAGWSFVFQKGIGGSSRDWDYFYPSGSILYFQKYMRTNGTAYGAFTFTMEFRTNWTLSLVYNLTIKAANDSSYIDVIHGPEAGTGYWISKTAQDIIVAARPENLTYPTTILDGVTYIKFDIYLNIVSSQRMQILMTDDKDVPDNNLIEIKQPYTGDNPVNMWFNGELREELFFSPWCTITIGNNVFNSTTVITQHHTQCKFWSGIGHWWDEHWVDILNVFLLAGGMFLMAVPGGQGFGMILLASALGLFLYDNVAYIRNLINAAIGLLIDGLKWLGQWLYKIGMMLWKALTWFIDQAIYYGGILIGLLIIGVAIALFVLPIYALVKIMGAFVLMAKGDYEKAAAQLSGVVSQGRNMVSTATGGRLG